MCAGCFLVLLDVTIVNVALPEIGSGLGTGVSGLRWGVGGYAPAPASLMLTSGTAGDLLPGGRAGLASAVSNTARQAGGAIGIAVAGADSRPPR